MSDSDSAAAESESPAESGIDKSLATRIVEPTGAGDAFAGGLLAGRLLGESTHRAIERGLVSAGIALDGFGPEALLSSTPAEAERRLQALRSTPESGSS